MSKGLIGIISNLDRANYFLLDTTLSIAHGRKQGAWNVIVRWRRGRYKKETDRHFAAGSAIGLCDEDTYCGGVHNNISLIVVETKSHHEHPQQH